jgi:CRP-like cAMP-binding protein
VRSATVKALGRARILTVDRKGFLRRVQEDPSLAFRVLQTMSGRIRELTDEVARLRAEGPGGEPDPGA